MSPVRSLLLPMFVALLAVGCGTRNPDPRHIELSDFDSGKQLGDTLSRLYPPGSRVSEVKDALQRDGIYCYEQGVVGADGHVPIIEGRPHLICMGSSRLQIFRRRQWLVWFPFDTARGVITEVSAMHFGELDRRH